VVDRAGHLKVLPLAAGYIFKYEKKISRQKMRRVRGSMFSGGGLEGYLFPETNPAFCKRQMTYLSWLVKCLQNIAGSFPLWKPRPDF
jgi:hypothetical protein